MSQRYSEQYYDDQDARDRGRERDWRDDDPYDDRGWDDRERQRRVYDDGYPEPRLPQHPYLKPVAITAAASILAGTLLGAISYGKNQFGIRDEGGTTVEKATVTKIIPIDEGCFLEYDADIQNARAAFDRKLQIGPFLAPTGFSYAVNFNGTIANRVCNDGASQKLTFNPETGEADVLIDASKMKIVVSRKNLNDPNAFTSDPGALTAASAIAPVAIKVLGLEGVVAKLPNGEDFVKGPDRLHTTMSNWAELAAYEVSSKSCAQKVWNDKQDTYADQVKQNISKLGSVFTAEPITPDKIEVKFTGKPKFTSQYGSQITDIEQRLSQLGMDITSQDPSTVTCESVEVDR